MPGCCELHSNDGEAQTEPPETSSAEPDAVGCAALRVAAA